MVFNEIVTSILIALGAGIMVLCILGTRQVLGLLQSDKYSQGWRTLFFLMIFFLVGYLAALAFVLTGIESFLQPLTGVVFFFGALFVYLVVQIGRLTINDLKQEIIERRQAEAALRFQKTLLECQMGASIDGILVVSDTREWLSFNQRFIEMWHIPPNIETMRSSHLAIRTVIDKVIEPEQFTDRILYLYEHKNEKSQDEVILKDGRIFDRYSAPVIDADSVYYGRVWYYRDITAQKRATEEICQLNTELEERVAQRTAQLEALNQELETFAYSVSHDIRAPLRAIYSYANFLAEDLAETLAPEQKRYLNGLTQAVDEAEALIADLLALSRLGRRDIRLERVKVGPFLQNLIASLNLPKDVKIELGPTPWPTLDTEPTLLRQIFQNLILNAVKFNRTSPKHIQLGWQLDHQQNYELFVRDNGIGIDPLYHEKIFGLFQRLHPSKEFEGTGIGLALVKKAARKLNGSVRITSAPGEGSTFFVTLPK